MRFSDAVKRVEKDDSHKDEHGYLVHGFRTFQDGEWSEWQIGYYHEDEDTITSYSVKDSVERSEPAEAFKREGSIPSLDKDEVSIPHDVAAKAADDHLKNNYPGHTATKTLLLLQALDDSQVYNITLVTDTLNMLNIKIDARTGEVLHESFANLMSLRADE